MQVIGQSCRFKMFPTIRLLAIVIVLTVQDGGVGCLPVEKSEPDAVLLRSDAAEKVEAKVEPEASQGNDGANVVSASENGDKVDSPSEPDRAQGAAVVESKPEASLAVEGDGEPSDSTNTPPQKGSPAPLVDKDLADDTPELRQTREEPSLKRIELEMPTSGDVDKEIHIDLYSVDGERPVPALSADGGRADEVDKAAVPAEAVVATGVGGTDHLETLSKAHSEAESNMAPTGVEQASSAVADVNGANMEAPALNDSTVAEPAPVSKSDDVPPEANPEEVEDSQINVSESEKDSQSNQDREARAGDFDEEEKMEENDNKRNNHKEAEGLTKPHHDPPDTNSFQDLVQAVDMKVISADMDEDNCDLMYRGPLAKLYKNSKYFADGKGYYTYAQALEVCRQNGLTFAEVDDIPDHRSLQAYITSYNPAARETGCVDHFFIGANCKETKGIYRRFNGRHITFQSFHRSQPDDANLTENCVVYSQENFDGPAGMSDWNCNKTAHVLCMFVPTTDCYKESDETKENVKFHMIEGMTFIANATRKSYYVSAFQSTWKNAYKWCVADGMNLITLDKIVNNNLFKKLMKWEANFTAAPTPPLEYWTAGRMRTTHMNAPIFWSTSSDFVPPEELLLPHFHEDRTPNNNVTFTFSGIYRWTSRKRLDPGGKVMNRRDICITFAFEGEKDPTPVIRNTNCDLPCYFICEKEYPKDEEEEEY